MEFHPCGSFCAVPSSAYLEEDELKADPSPVTHPKTFPEQHPCCAEIKASAWANVYLGRRWRRTRLRWGLQSQKLTFWGGESCGKAQCKMSTRRSYIVS